jgi:hypothetical protein
MAWHEIIPPCHHATNPLLATTIAIEGKQEETFDENLFFPVSDLLIFLL